MRSFKYDVGTQIERVSSWTVLKLKAHEDFISSEKSYKYTVFFMLFDIILKINTYNTR